MKDFTYIDNKFSLQVDACIWLRKMGLNETRWILDREWILNSHNNQITFSNWTKF